MGFANRPPVVFKVDKELQAWGPNNQNNGAATQRWGREREQTSSGCPVFSLLLIPVLSETPRLVLKGTWDALPAPHQRPRAASPIRQPRC